MYVTPFDEEYEITFPSAHAKGFLFGTLIMELVGPVHIICRKTGYSAEIEFKVKMFLVMGKIFFVTNSHYKKCFHINSH